MVIQGPQANADLDPPGKATGAQGINTNQGLVTSGVCFTYKLLLSQAEHSLGTRLEQWMCHSANIITLIFITKTHC